MSTSHSVDTIFTELLRTNANALEIITQVNAATTSSNTEVIAKVTLSDGTIQKFSFPSFSYLKNELARIDNEIQRLLGISDGSVSVRLADGTYSKIFLEKFLVEPDKMSNLPIPNQFFKKSNWFFEQFLNPLLYVSFDVKDKIVDNAERVLVKRLLLQLDSQDKLNYFNENLLNKNNLEYNLTIRNLSQKGISYFIDEDTIPLPPGIARYNGSFDVYDIVDETINTNINGIMVPTVIKKFFLSKLSYTDNTEPVKDNRFLKVGDLILKNNTTKYQITVVNTSEKYIEVSLIAGYEAINVGANQLNINPGRYSDKQVQVNVGFNEYQIIWLRAIDPDYEIAASEWGEGVAIYSNNLTIETVSGNINLEDYYLNEVSDFGKVFLGIAKDRVVPAIDGLKPDSPVLTESSFSIKQVNLHKDDSQDINQIKAKQSERLKTSSEIEKLNIGIVNKTKELNTTKFSSSEQRQSVRDELDSLIKQKSSKSIYYSSLITDLVARGKNIDGLANPKYRIRGFFPIPLSKSAPAGKQEVIQFVTSYRYLRKDGSATNVQTQSFTNINGSPQSASFSDWSELTSKVRSRVYDENTGFYIWAQEDPNNPDIVNINQVEISISANEQVEFRVRSVSEAGFPTNPLTSDWSNSIIIAFDDSLPISNETAIIINEANAEDIRLKFSTELTAVNQHIIGSFNSGDKYFAHSAEDISSEFFDSTGGLVDLYTKLKSMDTSIQTLTQTIGTSEAGIQISIVDPVTSKKSIIKNGDKIQLIAGYYTDIIDVNNPANWGSIITNNWNVVVENINSSPLELVSIFNDDQVRPLLETGNLEASRYKNVPIVLNNLKEGNERSFGSTGLGYSFINKGPYQSAQIGNQWLYSRERSLKGDSLYYVNSLNVNSSILDTVIDNTTTIVSFDLSNLNFVATVTPTTWTTQANGPFGVTVEYPYEDLYNFWLYNKSIDNTSAYIGPLNSTIGKVQYSEIISNYRDSSNSKLNGFYKNVQVLDASASSTNFKYSTASPMKGSFFTNDKYLVGQNTCLDYLFIAPDNYSTISVPGTFSFVTKKVNVGENNAIQIPLIYQWRMIDRSSNIIGGSDVAQQLRNLTWSKTIGLDIFYKNQGTIEVFSFDIEVISDYRKVKLS